MIAFISAVGLSLFPTFEEELEPKVVYKDETHLDFELVDVKGELIKPKGVIVLERQKAMFTPLLKLRSQFGSEMSQSVESIQ